MNAVIEKSLIISEIRRTAEENGGQPLGSRRFQEETGITVAKWRGRYWRAWGDALKEAGFEPNVPSERTDDDYLVLRLAMLAKKLGFFPTYADLRLERHSDETFPSHHVFGRLGSQEERIALLHDFATSNAEFSEILEFLPERDSVDNAADPAQGNLSEGFVYLAVMKVGNQKRYKIGKAVLTARRIDQISIQLPEDLQLIHHIRTDDAFGIEAYWHRRFAPKNTKGEWFLLSQDDIRAFKKRNFM